MLRAETVPAAALYSLLVDIVKQWGKKSSGLLQSRQERRELPFIYEVNKGEDCMKPMQIALIVIPRALLNTHQDGHERNGQQAKTTSDIHLRLLSVNKTDPTSGAAFL